VTAGGSAYFDVVVAALAGNPAWRVVLRSGCYATHDHGLYRSISAFERTGSVPGLVPALEVWAPVLSRPESRTAVVGAGRRDLSFDAGLPVPLRGRTAAGESVDLGTAVVHQLFDQHAILTIPDGLDLAPGDEVGLGISHPCTTFDKWRWIPVLDEGETVVDVVRTFF
jgi:D-serine deaminase-like pyridoxal phosphate-dependent protein